MKKLIAMLLAIVMVLALGACAAKERTPPASDNKTADTAAPAGDTAAPAGDTAAPAEEIIVAYMAKNTVDAFHATMNKKAGDIFDQWKSEGLIADWQLYDATTDPAMQISLLEDAISNGANMVALQPCEQAGSDPVVTRCNELGIPIVVINSYTDSTMELASGFAFSDDYDAGAMMADYVMSKIPEGGKFAHMMGVVGSSAQILRGQGVADKMNADSGWENVGDYAAEWLAEKAVAFATDVITQYGDELKAIVCDNDDMSSAVQAYCNSIGREDIVCIGVDGNKGPLTMVKEGKLGATVFQDGAGQVEYALNTIMKSIITGKTDGVNMKKDDIPFILVTKDNVDQYLQ